jgi:hypothetical protein
VLDAANNFQGCLIGGESSSQPSLRGTGSHLLELQIIDYSKNPLQLILKKDTRGQKKILNTLFSFREGAATPHHSCVQNEFNGRFLIHYFVFRFTHIVKTP